MARKPKAISARDLAKENLAKRPHYSGTLIEYEGGVADERCACGGKKYRVPTDADGTKTITCTVCGEPWPLLSYDELDKARLLRLYDQYQAEATGERLIKEDKRESKVRRDSSSRLEQRAEAKRLEVLKALERVGERER